MVDVKYMGVYDYIPSIPAAIVFAVVFGIQTVVHTWQLARSRTWFFIPFVIGGVFEIIGYAFRAVSSNQYPNYTIAPLAISSVAILVAPLLFAASIYMELGRIMMASNGEKYSPIRRSWLTKIFVLGDIISFLIQAGGASMLVRSSTAENGGRIIKFGLIVQFIFFGLFIITCIIFHIRMQRNPTATGYPYQNFNWKKHQIALYIGCLMILIRSIFRMYEYTHGGASTLIEHEYWQYVFDAVPMALLMAAFNVVYPGQISDHIRGRKPGYDVELRG